MYIPLFLLPLFMLFSIILLFEKYGNHSSIPASSPSSHLSSNITPFDVSLLKYSSITPITILSCIFHLFSLGYLRIKDGRIMETKQYHGDQVLECIFEHLFSDTSEITFHDLKNKIPHVMQDLTPIKNEKMHEKWEKKSLTCKTLSLVFSWFSVYVSTVIPMYIQFQSIIFSIVVAVVVSSFLYTAWIYLLPQFIMHFYLLCTKNRNGIFFFHGRGVYISICSKIYLVKEAFTFFIIFFFTGIFPFLYFVEPGLKNYDYILGFLVSIFCSFFMWLYARHFPKLTERGKEESMEIKSFEDFINTSSENTLEKCMNENMMYYLNMLPYTLVLGKHEKWKRRFEKISMERIAEERREMEECMRECIN